MNQDVLRIDHLKTYFHTHLGTAKAVDDLDLSLKKGQTLGIVGESGCGKSVTALSILRLIKDPPGKIVAGKILFDGQDLLKLPLSAMRKIRGNKISMIFQEPMTSLNPVFKVGDQISESFRLHQGLSKQNALDKSIEILEMVGIPAPEKRVRDYPHQLSGGMRQRVMIAMALSCKPKILIADEPTTALDVTIQAQILDLMLKLKEDTGTSILLITHDLGVIAEMTQFVVVMYAGKVMEYADASELFNNPLHPYTVGLLKSIPRLDLVEQRGKPLDPIPGVVPSLSALPKGCKFNDRCGRTTKRCLLKEPSIIEVTPDHKCRCWLYTE
ncbi:MAG: ABC transporter ATP-binding protein [Desulfobacterales bacterium]|nr:MAG: ABC transporter ATP-binding protein [Desulfobacterales bacterium]